MNDVFKKKMPETFEFSILNGKIIQPLFGRISHSLARQVSTAGKKICQITNISRQYAPPHANAPFARNGLLPYAPKYKARFIKQVVIFGFSQI